MVAEAEVVWGFERKSDERGVWFTELSVVEQDNRRIWERILSSVDVSAIVAGVGSWMS